MTFDRLSPALTGLCIALLVAGCNRDGDRTATPAASVAATTGGSQVTSSACDSLAVALCLRDTAYAQEVDYEPGRLIKAHSIIFAAATDSLELFAHSDGNREGAYISTNFGQDRDPKGNTASFKRLRMGSDGVVAVSVDFDIDQRDTIPYVIAVRWVGSVPSGPLKPTGRWATLAISSGRATDRYTVIPAGLANSVRDRSRWAVPARTYKVALVADSVYEICRVPCLLPDTVKLTPSGTATKRY